ncbi:unnamed protein product [Plutella xylostella]|uniref:(diamondback moth) hypothetical protein n=1 Tax=Plutella xylostella TaxID=51655 RepID=A0A8S4FZR2_PLUXY|nr:unnamed protein product [Plutella xylostella]
MNSRETIRGELAPSEPGLTSWGRGVARVCVCAHGTHGEPLLERTQATLTITQDKAYPMSSKLIITPPNTETETKEETKRHKRKSRFEPETSAEEDTDNEMMFMGPPNADENKGCNDLNLSFLSALDEDDSDSDNDSGVMDKLVNAIGHLFTDDSSDEEDVSSAAASEAEMIPNELDGDKAVSFTDAEAKGKREGEHKTVTLQEPEREDSMDSGLDTEAFMEKMCTYFILESESDIKFTLTPSLCNVLNSLMAQFTDKTRSPAPPAPAPPLLNYIGPGSTVHLITRSETDLAGHDRTLAVADYDAGDSRPSTPDCDTSSADMLDELEVKMPGIPEIVADGDEEADCFEAAFRDNTPIRSPQLVPESTQELYARITDQRLSIRVHDLDELTVLCPQKSVQKLHVLHPSRNGTRYYVVVERKTGLNRNTIVVRSPLQIRNETSYPLELYYRKRDLQALGVEVIGSILNPFEGLLRVGTVAPADTYTVPLYIAYHSTLLLKPTHPQNYQTASQGIWWMDLANDMGTPRDLICPAKEEGDSSIFAMRVVATEAIYNRLTYALELSIEALSFRVRIEAGERVYSHIINLLTTHLVNVEIHNQGQLWTGSFKMKPTMTDKRITLLTDSEGEGGNKQLHVSAALSRADCTRLCLYAPYWLINKTGAPMQLKVCRSDTIYKLTTPGVVTARGGDRFKVSLGGGWARSFPPRAAPPAALRAAPPAPTTTLCQITLSELCPQLTKIVTFLPLYIVYNDTKRHLRFMEENEAADLWLDLAPQQCTAFYPQTTSMMMHCKYRDSRLVSAHFPINVNHTTVLRMDKGSAIVVQNTGGVDRPFVITFKPYTEGDAPVKVVNLCDDLFLKLHQIHSGQVALLSPYQSMLYTWDDPSKERALVWNIYNNKGKGFVADFSKDGFGEEKVSFHSVKHTTLVATNSVTSKLSSTLKRLTPKSPSPNSSSSDDSDSSDLPEVRTKKMRKDKVIVFWISYREGYQRVFALTQDERIASQYRMRITPEKSSYEFIMSVPNISLSACVQTKNDVKELAYISITDSLPSWEVHVSHKWKELSPDLTAWIEDKYQTEQKKCQLKDYIHIDLEKMQMTKPFFSELRRTYNPGIWLQLRKSETHTYLNLKIHRLQVDNQLNDAIFPCVLYPAPVPPHLKKPTYNPSLEMSFLKQYKYDINQEVYKHFKILIEEHCLKLDRGFVNYVFDILNHWKVEEKPAVRLRADLASVHMPLLLIAMKSQFYGPKDVVFENVYMSPVKLSVSLSSRGYSAESPNPRSSWLSSKHENRPRLFNSDLLEHLFSSWGASLSDMKDVEIVIPAYTTHNVALPLRSLLEQWRLHGYPPLLQQIYVKILALQILVNRRTVDTGANGTCTEELAGGQVDISKLLGRGLNSHRAACQYEVTTEAIPASVLEASRSHPAYIVLALSGLIAKPNLDEEAAYIRNLCRSAARAPLTRQLGSVCCVLRCLQRRVEARRRLPRHCTAPEGFPCYCYHSGVGQQLFLQLSRGHFADSGCYLAHAALPRQPHVAVLVSTR